MSDDPFLSQKVLYWIACGSSAATRVVEPGVQAAQQAGWDVCVITTPNGRNFLNLPRLAQLTEHPVRSEYKLPDTPDLLPRADALLVYPASFRTINTWVTGDSATLVVGLLCEYLGLGVPIVAIPYTGEGLDRHPAFCFIYSNCVNGAFRSSMIERSIHLSTMSHVKLLWKRFIRYGNNEDQGQAKRA